MLTATSLVFANGGGPGVVGRRTSVHVTFATTCVSPLMLASFVRPVVSSERSSTRRRTRRAATAAPDDVVLLPARGNDVGSWTLLSTPAAGGRLVEEFALPSASRALAGSRMSMSSCSVEPSGASRARSVPGLCGTNMRRPCWSRRSPTTALTAMSMTERQRAADHTHASLPSRRFVRVCDELEGHMASSCCTVLVHHAAAH
jgi:hypothetical protein